MNGSMYKAVSLRSIGGITCRLIITLSVLASMIACASVEPQQGQPIEVEKAVMDGGLANANIAYITNDYDTAIKEFSAVAVDPATGANSRRMAYLGQALIYLGSDKEFYSLENAKLALRSADQVTPVENEEFSLASEMLMDAVVITIGSQSRYAELYSKSGRYSSEVVRLKSERDKLQADNIELIKEQAALNDALERLKNLTLGN